MKIAVDVQALFSPVFKGRGIANYLYNQLDTMFQLDTQNEYILFNLYSEESALEAYFSGASYPHVTEFKLYTGLDQFLIQSREENGAPRFRTVLKGVVKTFLQKNQIDVFFYASPFDYWNYFEAEWFEGVRTVATVYDIIPYVMQDVYLQDPAAKAEYMRKVEFLRGFDKILAISQSVKDDLVEKLSFAPGQVDVVYAGISSFYSMGEVDQAQRIRIQQQYGIKDEFIFVAGGCDPRKNMPQALQAYAKLPEELKEKYQLVFVCKLVGRYPALLRETARQGGLSEDRVVLTDFVPDEDILFLYRMARVTLFPSQYEGFGLPIIESMACGTPVVTSDNSSLGEVAKGAAELVNPYDVEDISRGLYTALQDSARKYAAEMAEKVKRFTWEKSGELSIESIESLASVKRDFHTAAPSHIAVFSPLPPQPSGIADYTLAFLSAVGANVEVDVFIDEGYTPDVTLPQNVAVRPHAEYESLRGKYDATLYQMGNDCRFHYYMLPYIRRFGGAVELHDVNLHNMLQHKTVDIDQDLDTYQQYLSEDYANADEIVEKMRETGVSPVPEDMPLNGAVTRYASQVIVHSEYARDKLLQMDVARDAAVVPHFVLGKALDNKQAARESLGIGRGTLVFATFGAITPTRRLAPLVRAFAAANLQGSKLHITGGFASEALEEELKALVIELKLVDRVCFTGRLEEEALNRYIGGCDVCVNLRWPYHGESSGILARVLQAGKAAVVTDVGSFAELPDDICRKLPIPTDDAGEVEMIAKALCDLHDNPAEIQALGENAERYANEYLNRERLARQIVAYAVERRDFYISEPVLQAISHEILGGPEEKIPYEIMKMSESIGYLL